MTWRLFVGFEGHKKLNFTKIAPWLSLQPYHEELGSLETREVPLQERMVAWKVVEIQAGSCVVSWVLWRYTWKVGLHGAEDNSESSGLIKWEDGAAVPWDEETRINLGLKTRSLASELLVLRFPPTHPSRDVMYHFAWYTVGGLLEF